MDGYLGKWQMIRRMESEGGLERLSISAPQWEQFRKLLPRDFHYAFRALRDGASVEEALQPCPGWLGRGEGSRGPSESMRRRGGEGRSGRGRFERNGREGGPSRRRGGPPPRGEGSPPGRGDGPPPGGSRYD